MSKILEKDPHVRHRIATRQYLVHIRLPGQPLDVMIAQMLTNRSRRLSLLYQKYCMIPNPEDPPVGLHELLARQSQCAHIAACESLLRRVSRQSSAEHRVVNPLAGRRRDDARPPLSRQEDVAPVVPTAQRLHRNLARPPAGSSWRPEVRSTNAASERTSSAKSPFSRCPSRRSSCRHAGRSMRRNRATAFPDSGSRSEILPMASPRRPGSR